MARTPLPQTSLRKFLSNRYRANRNRSPLADLRAAFGRMLLTLPLTPNQKACVITGRYEPLVRTSGN
jgi:hypothetical protein